MAGDKKGYFQAAVNFSCFFSPVTKVGRDKPIADAEININKTLTMMKRRKGKKKLKPTKAELDEKAEKGLSFFLAETIFRFAQRFSQ